MSSDMSTRITQQQLESYLWGAATLLRGTIDAGDYKQFIFPLLFYKRLCDVFDEETQTALEESGGDAAVRRLPGEPPLPDPARGPLARGAAGRQERRPAPCRCAMRAIETANPDKLYGIFGDAQWTNKDRLSDAMLRDLVEHFSALELTHRQPARGRAGPGLRIPHQEVRRRLRPHRRRVLHQPHRRPPDDRDAAAAARRDRSTTRPAVLAACCSPPSRTCAGRARSGATCASTGRSAT